MPKSCLAWCRVLMDRKSKRSQIVIGILNRVSRHDRRRTTRILDSETWQWTRAQILWAFWFDISVVLLKYGLSWVLYWAFPSFSVHKAFTLFPKEGNGRNCNFRKQRHDKMPYAMMLTLLANECFTPIRNMRCSSGFYNDNGDHVNATRNAWMASRALSSQLTLLLSLLLIVAI